MEERNEEAVQSIRDIANDANYREEYDSPRARALELEGERTYDRMYDPKSYEESREWYEVHIERLWKRHEVETGASPMEQNKEIAAEMRARYPEIPQKLVQDLGLVGVTYPPRTMEQPHPDPEQPRFTRAEIRAMIDAALPEIKETQRARARDLSAERDGHGY
jgi:hypothetical protein